ncbi:hypothetical protein DL769_007052 [Monosporascus sp. CRB-8-3]|nr:hypothetical protein DL769_007052 [Monosporascus sp. CRB-8-3]
MGHHDIPPLDFIGPPSHERRAEQARGPSSGTGTTGANTSRDDAAATEIEPGKTAKAIVEGGSVGKAEQVLALASNGVRGAAIITPVYASHMVPETTRHENLLSQAAPADTGPPDFGGRGRNVSSIVLPCNGISFAISGCAIPGHRRTSGVSSPPLYMLGLICYQLTMTDWAAAFPALARNTPRLREAARAYASGEIAQAEHDKADEAERSRLSNVAFYIRSVGEIGILAVIVGVMFGVHVNDGDTEANSWGLGVLIAVATAFWVALGSPWSFLEKKRPGLKISDSLVAGLQVGLDNVSFKQNRQEPRAPYSYCSERCQVLSAYGPFTFPLAPSITGYRLNFAADGQRQGSIRAPGITRIVAVSSMII